MSNIDNDTAFLVRILTEAREQPGRMPYELRAIDYLLDHLTAQTGDECPNCGSEYE
jgi:hypothetical protein